MVELKVLLSTLVTSYYLLGLLFFTGFTIFSNSAFYELLVVHGKTNNEKHSPWQVPKKLFTLFYGIGMISAVTIFKFESLQEWMLLLHLTRRLLESTLWPYSRASKMHLIHALVGVTYYPIVVLSFVLCTSKFHSSTATFSIFLLLNFLQSYFHSILYKFRNGYTEYIPIGDIHPVFKVILCPHYLMEILIYLLFACMSKWSQLLVLNVFFVTFNLAISAISTKYWYMKRFPNATHQQPSVLIPYIF